MGRDAFENLAMAVFVSAAMWLGASHGTGARTVEEPSVAAVRDHGPKDSVQIAFPRDPADAYSAGGYWDWIEQQHAMP